MLCPIFALGFLSFIVWPDHMFLTGMGTALSAFFQATMLIISIPSVIVVTSLLLSLYGGSIRFATPMLFALAFLPMSCLRCRVRCVTRLHIRSYARA